MRRVQARSSFRITRLVQTPELVPVLAEWFASEWPGFFGAWERPRLTEFVQGHADADGLPTALVCLNGEGPVGTVALRNDTIEGFEDMDPWLAGLYVVPGLRRMGVGKLLVEAALKEAGRLGFPHVYAGTRVEILRAAASATAWESVGEGRSQGGPSWKSSGHRPSTAESSRHTLGVNGNSLTPNTFTPWRPQTENSRTAVLERDPEGSVGHVLCRLSV